VGGPAFLVAVNSPSGWVSFGLLAWWCDCCVRVAFALVILVSRVGAPCFVRRCGWGVGSRPE